jgi:SAM-dependent methyltransferase
MGVSDTPSYINPAELTNIARSQEHFWWYRGQQQILFRLLDLMSRRRNVQRVLEAGCGTGYDALSLEQRYGWHVFPLDLEMDGLRYGRLRGLTRLSQGDVAALPFRSGAFDIVVSLDVIVYYPGGGEEKPIAEFSRVLAPGGLLVLRVSALDVLRSRHSEFTFKRQRFTCRRLVELVSRHGICVERCTYVNALLFPVALAKFRLWEPLTRQRPQSGVQPVSKWLNRVLLLLLVLESRWIGAGGTFPVGQSLILIGEKRQ